MIKLLFLHLPYKSSPLPIKRSLYYLLPASMRFWARKLYYAPVDVKDKLMGKNDKLIPPKGKIFVGSGNFKDQGQHFIQLFFKYAGLHPQSKVLDVGCGIGRMAVPLLDFITPPGRYDGFDLVKDGIEWCEKEIHSRNKNFVFKRVDLANTLYNPKGKIRPHEFTFPYPDEHFDFTCLTSVFTHMLCKDMLHYLDELHRVLESGGHAFITYFTFEKALIPALEKGDCEMPFPHEHKNFRLMDHNLPTANIAFAYDWLVDQIQTKGFAIEHEIKGWWKTGVKDESFQDVLILKKL